MTRTKFIAGVHEIVDAFDGAIMDLWGCMHDGIKAFKKMLDSYGVDLIVDRIESEPMLLELLDLHIDFGQGYLSGEPRIAKAESTPPLM